MKDPLSRPTRRLLLKAGIAGAIAATHAGAQGPAGAPRSARSGSEEAGEGAAGKQPDGGISPVMQTVSTYIAQAAKQALPEAAAEATKHHLLDTLAAMVSGSRLAPGVKAIAYVKTLGGTPQSCIPGTRIVTNAVNAALAGGMCAHADETDDSHERSLTHPGCGVVPAALAMAERGHASGTALLRAVALGYDICTRLSLALGAYGFFAAGHSTHGYGHVFGAAAAAGSIAGLNADQVRYMLSYTAQQASGVSYQLRDNEHIEKAFDLGGMAARNGVSSATMIASGITSGVDDAFSGERNFFFAFGPKTRPEELTRELGTTFEAMNTNIKRWSVGSPSQAPLDSLSYLIKTHKFTAADVDKVVIRISHRNANIVDNRDMPNTSMQHLAAVMLLDGTVTFAATHDKARMQDPQVLAVRKRVELYGDDEMDRVMPSRQGIVEVALRDGRQLRHHTVEVRGSVKNPMNREEVDEKCYPLLYPVLGKERARALIDTIWRIESVQDARALRPLLFAPAG